MQYCRIPCSTAEFCQLCSFPTISTVWLASFRVCQTLWSRSNFDDDHRNTLLTYNKTLRL